MTRNNLILRGGGITLIVLAVIFSLIPYNPGNYETVHLYAYGCNTNTLRGYSYIDPESAQYACQNNTMLSAIIFGIGIGGAFLIIKRK